MRWLESIRLRTVQAPAERIVAALRAHLEGLRDEAGLVGANLYGGLMPRGDFSLILFWSTDQAQPCGSLAARLLLPLLREHGLVSHTVWVGKQPDRLRRWGPDRFHRWRPDRFLRSNQYRTQER